MTLLCARCQTALPDGANFCPKCGQPTAAGRTADTAATYAAQSTSCFALSRFQEVRDD